MATAKQKNDAAEVAEVDALDDDAATPSSIVFVDALPEKAVVTRTNWWDTIAPMLDANPDQWALVYTGKADSPNPDRNALSRKVRTIRTIKERVEEGTYTEGQYEVEKRDLDIYARRVAS